MQFTAFSVSRMPRRKSKKTPADTLDECVNSAILRTREAIEQFDFDGGKDSVANLAKLVSVIGELRDMVGISEREDTQTGVILLPERKDL